MFSWEKSKDNFRKLYHYLMKRDSLGGACGEVPLFAYSPLSIQIEVLSWKKNPILLTQFFEYKSNQFLAKTAENWFGMVDKTA